MSVCIVDLSLTSCSSLRTYSDSLLPYRDKYVMPTSPLLLHWLHSGRTAGNKEKRIVLRNLALLLETSVTHTWAVALLRAGRREGNFPE